MVGRTKVFRAHLRGGKRENKKQRRKNEAF
jgi:hypothetical protein